MTRLTNKEIRRRTRAIKHFQKFDALIDRELREVVRGLGIPKKLLDKDFVHRSHASDPSHFSKRRKP